MKCLWKSLINRSKSTINVVNDAKTFCYFYKIQRFYLSSPRHLIRPKYTKYGAPPSPTHKKYFPTNDTAISPQIKFLVTVPCFLFILLCLFVMRMCKITLLLFWYCAVVSSLEFLVTVFKTVFFFCQSLFLFRLVWWSFALFSSFYVSIQNRCRISTRGWRII